jgi:hypothetical protein
MTAINEPGPEATSVEYLAWADGEVAAGRRPPPPQPRTFDLKTIEQARLRIIDPSLTSAEYVAVRTALRELERSTING